MILKYKMYKYKKGSMIIELSLLMPAIMAVIFFIIFYCMFLHDKCAIERAAYKAIIIENTHNKTIDYVKINDTFEEELSKSLCCKWDIDKNFEKDDEEIKFNIHAKMKVYSGILFRLIDVNMFRLNTCVKCYIY